MQGELYLWVALNRFVILLVLDEQCEFSLHLCDPVHDIAHHWRAVARQRLVVGCVRSKITNLKRREIKKMSNPFEFCRIHPSGHFLAVTLQNIKVWQKTAVFFTLKLELENDACWYET